MSWALHSTEMQKDLQGSLQRKSFPDAVWQSWDAVLSRGRDWCCCACGRPVVGACIPLSRLCLPAQPVLLISRKQGAVIPAQTAGLVPGRGQGSPGVGTQQKGEHCSQTGQGTGKQRILFPWDTGGTKNNDSTSGKVLSPAVVIPGCPALAHHHAVPCWVSGRDLDQAGNPDLKGS